MESHSLVLAVMVVCLGRSRANGQGRGEFPLSRYISRLRTTAAREWSIIAEPEAGCECHEARLVVVIAQGSHHQDSRLTASIIGDATRT
jgi:hypothetical protein